MVSFGASFFQSLGESLVQTLDLLSEKDYFKAIFIFLDLYGSPLFPTLGAQLGVACTFMQL